MVQQELQRTDDSGGRRIVEEFRGYVCLAVQDAHANHIIQLAIQLLRPNDIRFVFDELDQAVTQQENSWTPLAEHKYCCRVLIRLIEHFPLPELASLIDRVVYDAERLCCHEFGNYVVQALLEHSVGNQMIWCSIVCALKRIDLEKVVCDRHQLGVLTTALVYGNLTDQKDLAMTIFLYPQNKLLHNLDYCKPHCITMARDCKRRLNFLLKIMREQASAAPWHPCNAPNDVAP